MRIFHFISLFAAFLALSKAPIAYGLTIDIQGKVAFVSGGMDYPDVRRLDAAYDSGVRFLVLRNIGGTLVEISDAVSRSIKEKAFTTIIDRPCGVSCIKLFLSGKERYFGKAEKLSVAYIAGAVEEGTNNPASDTTIYISLSRNFGPGMPRSLLNKYTTAWSGTSYLAISQPNNVYPEGALWHCEEEGTCKIINPALTAMSVGFITSPKLFDIEKLAPIDADVSKPSTE